MDVEPTELRPQQRRQLEEHVTDLNERLQEHVRDVLDEIESDRLRTLTEKIAFSPNELLSRHISLPEALIAYLAEQVYRSYAPRGEQLEPILQCAMIVQEYYDLVDSLVADQVPRRLESTVVTITQLLLLFTVRRLNTIGPDVLDYWTARALQMVESLYSDATSPESLDGYLESLDEQSYLYASVTGLAAVASGEGDAEIARSEELGRLVFHYTRFVLDLYRDDFDDEGIWTASSFMSEEDIVLYLKEWRDRIEVLVRAYPVDRAQKIRSLLSTELSHWRRIR